MLLEELQNIVLENKESRKDFLRNLLKEYLQLIVLEFIYNSKYSFLIFKGGSCLRVCFDLPRLSEDLDFDYPKKLEIRNFFEDLINFFKKEKNFPQLETKISKERLYLKFPILKELKIAKENESEKLYLKIELAKTKECSFKTELDSIFKQGFSFLLKRYSQEDLMAGKICAVLERVWFKGKKSEIKVKGRDFFDLYWFMKQKVIPNYNCVFYQNRQISPREIWDLIEKKIEKINPYDLRYDLLPLIKDQNFVKQFSSNFKSLIKKEIKFYKNLKSF